LDDVDRRIIEDRNRDIASLDRDMEELAELYVDVNCVITEQGESVRRVTARTTNVSSRMGSSDSGLKARKGEEIQKPSGEDQQQDHQEQQQQEEIQEQQEIPHQQEQQQAIAQPQQKQQYVEIVDAPKDVLSGDVILSLPTLLEKLVSH
jgi:hypothetical protein